MDRNCSGDCPVSGVVEAKPKKTEKVEKNRKKITTQKNSLKSFWQKTKNLSKYE